MKIAPLSVTDPWFAHVTGHSRAFVETLAGVPVEATVLADHVALIHRGPESNYRPVLHLCGRLTDVEAPQVKLPFGVDSLAFEPGHGQAVDAFYEFDNEQLAELARKGYFEDGFAVPSEMVGVPWVLPATARLVFVSPESGLFSPHPSAAAPAEMPIVFLGLEDANSLVFDKASSGYELTAYFRRVQEQPRKALAAELIHRSGPQHEEADLFADEKQQEQTAEAVLSAAERQKAEAGREAVSAAEARYREQILARLEPLAPRESLPDGVDVLAPEILELFSSPLEGAEEAPRSRRDARTARLQAERDALSASFVSAGAGASGDDLEFE